MVARMIWAAWTAPMLFSFYGMIAAASVFEDCAEYVVGES
jgi:uncharacterized membrane protein YhfC